MIKRLHRFTLLFSAITGIVNFLHITRNGIEWTGWSCSSFTLQYIISKLVNKFFRFITYFTYINNNHLYFTIYAIIHSILIATVMVFITKIAITSFLWAYEGFKRDVNVKKDHP